MAMSEGDILLRSMERFFEKTKVSLQEAFADGRYGNTYASISNTFKDEVDDLVFGENFSKLTSGQKTAVEGKIKKGEDHSVSSKSYKASEGAIYDAVVEYKDQSSILVEEILAEIKSKMEIIIHPKELNVEKDKTETIVKGIATAGSAAAQTQTVPVKVTGKIKDTGVKGHIKADGGKSEIK